MSAVSPNGDVPESPRSATSTEPTAVERTIAEAISRSDTGFPLAARGCLARASVLTVAADVAVAIRAMSPQQQAELIGGEVLREWAPDPNHEEYEADGVLYKPLHGWTCQCDDGPGLRARAVGPWREERP